MMQLLAVLLCGAALKFHYSTTSVDGLRWILAPTTYLIHLVTGVSFQFEPHAGYMSSDHAFLIAASCAGVNFLVTAFLMLALSLLWRNRFAKLGWKFIPLSAALAYAATLVANTVRVSTAIRLQRLPAEISWLSPDQLHRIEGVFIYFGFLLLLFAFSEWINQRQARPAEEFLSSRQALFPLLIYYATTLVIPFANGAYRQGSDFWQHALFVFLVPLVLILPLIVLRVLRRPEVIPMQSNPIRR